jgi:predicted anti-sigma-YlaC factor YlaD
MTLPLEGTEHSTCREMAEQVSDYLDGELAASLREVIDRHRGDCPPCEAFVRTLARTVELIRAQPQEPLPPERVRDLTEALRRAAHPLRP